MSFAVTIDGLEEVQKMFNNLKDTTKVKQAALNGALMIEGDAKQSIMHSGGGGRTYGRHTASAPGEPPATNTGLLASSIQHWVSEDGFTIAIGSNLPYAADLEYGTRHMAARPFIEPALDKNHTQIVADIVSSIGASA